MASLLGMQGRLGVVEPGALADLTAVDDDPLTDIALLTDPDHRLRLVMCRGRLHKMPRD